MLTDDGLSHWVPDPGVGPALENITVADLIDRAAERRPDGEALVYSQRDYRLTYAELRDEVMRVAHALIDSGLEPGDRVVVWATNVHQFPVMQWACAYANLTMVPINPLYRRKELLFVLDRVDANAIFFVPEDRGVALWEILDQVSPQVPTLGLQVAFHQAPGGGAVDWDTWLSAHAEPDQERVLKQRQTANPEDLSQIQFTSGTTGLPKGVELTNWILANQGLHMAARAELVESDRWVNPMPLFHCGGCVVAAMSILAARATHLPIILFDPKQVCDTIEREKATFVAAVPTMLIGMQEEVERNRQGLHSLRTVVSGGSVVPRAVGEHWQQSLGVDFVITYGQTEFGPLVSVTSPQDPKERQITTCGRPIANVELDVVAPGTSERVAIGEEGELRYRGFVMRGYHKDPDETAGTIDAEGWLRSGDLGRLDAEAYVQITGRAKDMIIRGGENISPASVEDAVRGLKGVADVSVIGVPDERFGEEICAFVRLEDGVELTATGMREQLLGEVARFMIPRYLVVLEEFPTTPSGKIQKFKLREMFVEANEEGRVQDNRSAAGSGSR